MPYISIKDLRKIDNYLTKQCSMNLIQNMTEEEADKEIEEYCEVVQIFHDLYKKGDTLNEKSRERMRRYRLANPEKAKARAKAYNKWYYENRRRSK